MFLHVCLFSLSLSLSLRVWEKIMERLQEVGANITGIKKKLGDWAKGVGTKTGRNIQRR